MSESTNQPTADDRAAKVAGETFINLEQSAFIYAQLIHEYSDEELIELGTAADELAELMIEWFHNNRQPDAAKEGAVLGLAFGSVLSGFARPQGPDEQMFALMEAQMILRLAHFYFIEDTAIEVAEVTWDELEERGRQLADKIREEVREQMARGENPAQGRDIPNPFDSDDADSEETDHAD